MHGLLDQLEGCEVKRWDERGRGTWCRVGWLVSGREAETGNGLGRCCVARRILGGLRGQGILAHGMCSQVEFARGADSATPITIQKSWHVPVGIFQRSVEPSTCRNGDWTSTSVSLHSLVRGSGSERRACIMGFADYLAYQRHRHSAVES